MSLEYNQTISLAIFILKKKFPHFLLWGYEKIYYTLATLRVQKIYFTLVWSLRGERAFLIRFLDCLVELDPGDFIAYLVRSTASNLSCFSSSLEYLWTNCCIIATDLSQWSFVTTRVWANSLNLLYMTVFAILQEEVLASLWVSPPQTPVKRTCRKKRC